jgi:hypothetical protein
MSFCLRYLIEQKLIGVDWPASYSEEWLIIRIERLKFLTRYSEKGHLASN